MILLLSYTPDLKELAIIIGLLTIAVYIITIEVPGFLLLSDYDEKTIEVLKVTRSNLIEIQYNFNKSIKQLEDILESNKKLLQGIGAYEQLKYYKDSSIEMGRSNKSAFDLLFINVNQLIQDTEKQSKHPFQKLVDILSLAGLSFLIAQLLK